MKAMSPIIVREIFIAAIVHKTPSKVIAQKYQVTVTQVDRIRRGSRCGDITKDLREQFVNKRLPDLLGEVWLPVSGFDDYHVSNLGRVKRVKNGWAIAAERLMKLNPTENGYLHVTLKQDGESATLKVHRVVARAFIGEIPEGQFVNHVNGVKTDNCAANLEYVTASENMRHAMTTGLWNPCKKRKSA